MTSYRSHWRPLDLRHLGGATPLHGSSQANMWIPGGGGEPIMAYKGVGLEGGGGWQTVESAQQPTSPPLADVDVSCLLS